MWKTDDIIEAKGDCKLYIRTTCLTTNCIPGDLGKVKILCISISSPKMKTASTNWIC